MQRLPHHTKTTFVVLLVIAAVGIAVNVMQTSWFRLPMSFVNSSTAVPRPFNKIADFSKSRLNNFESPSTNSSELQSKPNIGNESGFSEKGFPIVKIYDLLPEEEPNADNKKRFEEIKRWLIGKPETKPEVTVKCTSGVKKILWFDVWHGGTGVRNKCRKVDFSKCDCRCEVDFFIFNETHKTYDPFGADAVMFQINKLATLERPPLKSEHQVFVAVEREATPEVKIPSQNFEYVFNWTMTFREDSDIFYPYGRIVEREGAPPAKDYSAIYKKKKKAIVWFVSHCTTKIGREEYAEKLRKYIDIDIVGKCGSDICRRHDAKKCFPKFEEEYFFLFNYENTHHTDYVTEKLYDNYHRDMVQIVCGAADYDSLVPDNTVVDVNKFESPKALATYLKTLMDNEELYTNYLKKKGNYYSERLNEQSQRAYCELCTMLHDADRYRNLYKNIGDWFVS